MIRKITTALLLSAIATAGVTPLPLGETQVEARRSAKVAFVPGSPYQINLRFDDPEWNSGVRLLPPTGSGHWDLSAGKILAADVENVSTDKQMRLNLTISSGEENDRKRLEVVSGIALNPGEKRTITLPIPHRRLFATPAGVPGPKVIDSDKIDSIDFHLQWPFEGKRPDLVNCRISNLRLEGSPDASTVVPREKFLPFIDAYGQNLHSGWPEKIRSDKDLPQEQARELAELATSKRPQEWNCYGGWANGPKLEATGNFRTEKYQGKWYFVDPDGCLFFSQGIDVLRAHSDATKTKNHEKWFGFPVTAEPVPFTDLNLKKKYAKDDYEADFYGTLSKRLEHWGMNTIGNWSKSELMVLGQTPYTLQLTDYNRRFPRIAGSKLKFYDVFDPAYAAAMKTLVATASARDPAIVKSLTDPMCIGYFIDNELNFGNRGRQMLGDDVMASPAKQASKREFAKDLKAKYASIEKLNAAWKSSYPDWDALLTQTKVPDSKGFKTDSDIFFRKAVDQYFRLCRDAVKSAAPHRLYLGCRFIATDAIRPALREPAKKYCDVLSVNVYAHSVANFAGGGFPDMPVLISEFHFGVIDRGMFSSGLAFGGLTQQDRAVAYTRFLQGALANPAIVGTHWFQFRDQPLTGRGDGEAYAIGFVDVVDTPYPELIRASREIGETMYQQRLSRKEASQPTN